MCYLQTPMTQTHFRNIDRSREMCERTLLSTSLFPVRCFMSNNNLIPLSW